MGVRAMLNVGDVYHRWTIISGRIKHLTKTGSRRYFYLCRCKCGTEREVDSYGLLSGRSRSCGCLQKDTAKTLVKKDAGLNKLYGRYKGRTIKSGKEFSLSKEEFRDVVAKPCFYCGDTPSKESRATADESIFIYTGIDRVDNSRGYTSDNVVPCCIDCNKTKMDRSLSDFAAWVTKVYDNFILEV